MSRFRYDASARWYKGNTHLHSIASDGGKDFPEIGGMYAAAGYHFLFRTDHSVASDVAGDSFEAPLLWLDGAELGGHDATGAMYHVICLGEVAGMDASGPLEEALAEAARRGAIRILAHPHWSGNTMDDAMRHGFDGVEIYNHICQWLNGKSDGRVYWEHMLRRRDTLAFAADDAHLKKNNLFWNGGWIVINAPELTRNSVLTAIRSGNYYSSCGPAFESIEADGRHVKVSFSPVKFARLVGPGPQGDRRASLSDEPLRWAEFDVPEDWSYAWIELEDAAGRRAWTNNLFVTQDAEAANGRASRA